MRCVANDAGAPLRTGHVSVRRNDRDLPRRIHSARHEPTLSAPVPAPRLEARHSHPACPPFKRITTDLNTMASIYKGLSTIGSSSRPSARLLARAFGSSAGAQCQPTPSVSNRLSQPAADVREATKESINVAKIVSLGGELLVASGARATDAGHVPRVDSFVCGPWPRRTNQSQTRCPRASPTTRLLTACGGQESTVRACPYLGA